MRARITTMCFPLAVALVSILGGMLNQSDARAQSIEWNDRNVDWEEYDYGLSRADRKGMPVPMVLYADWCPVCKQYAAAFRDPAVVELAKRFIMVKINIDNEKDLSAKYGLDGQYVPRTFVLNSDGEVMQDLFPARPKFRYYVRPATAPALADLMRRALDKR